MTIKFYIKLFKNPVFILGLIMMYILYSNLDNKGFFAKRNKKMLATSCRSSLVMLNKRVPSHWKVDCEDNNMSIEYQITDHKMDRQKSYRDLANNLIFLSKNSPVDSMERTGIIRIRVHHKNFIINAITEGKDITKFRYLTDQRLIADQIKNTVQVQEINLQKKENN